MAQPHKFRVLRGPTNTGLFEAEDRYLLIGCAPPDDLRSMRVDPSAVEWVLLTHHHRTAWEGVTALAELGAKIAVPEAELLYFRDPARFWCNDSRHYHAYNFHPSHLLPRTPVAVERCFREYETMEWRGLPILAVSAPGPTAGGMAYLVTLRGKTLAFIGELMSGHGKLRDFWSLQGRRSFESGELMEYHGFGERAADVVGSLQRIAQEAPEVMIPSRGTIIQRPQEAVALLSSRLSACRMSYHTISSGRWYFPTVWPDVPDITDALRKRCRPLPPWVVELGGTSRALVGEHGGTLLVDCAGDTPRVVAERCRQGNLGPVEYLWITHYHDDHVDKVQTFRRSHPTRVIVHESMADILERPAAYWMPCLHEEAIAPDHVTTHGESWNWGGFRLTALTFPGQTIFDAALLVERDGQRVLFVGDSLTPGGLDDYCALNRNLLGSDMGYDRSLAVLEGLGSDVLLVNQHVPGAFVFSNQEIRSMREELARRTVLFRELLDWDDPNYGLDPQWVRADPYWQHARRGSTARWKVWVQNHSRIRRRFVVTLHAPSHWRPVGERDEIHLPSHQIGQASLGVEVPANATLGRAVVAMSVARDGKDFGEIAEALVDVE